MCGIYGTTIEYDDGQIEDKLRRTAFRGPDKLGFRKLTHSKGTVTFGHNRLAIIDLDPRSDQPFNYNDLVEIAFNGEIYNFKEIKSILEKNGYVFNTTSDTEVICAAYLEYGTDCVNHFNGMFAFVIYDIKKQCLFGARDRLGQKPFYYYHNGTSFEFSSQVSSIALHSTESLSISKAAILEYLKWGNIPDPFCIYNEVQKLRAGQYFTFDLPSGEMSINTYWDIDISGKSSYSGDYEEAKSDLDVLLKDAVKSRMFADVPVGVFLSGGVDSSLVAAMAVATTTSSVKTFSVKFNEKGFDESRYAQQVADHLHTEHHIIECNYREGLDLIENFTHFYDEPFADNSAIPSMLLAKHTRKKVTVALSGDGGDESFLGYHRYNWMLNRKAPFSIPTGLRKTAAALIGLSTNHRAEILAKGLAHESVEHLYIAKLTDIDLSWIDYEWSEDDIIDKKYLFHKNKNLLERISDYDIKTYLNSEINTKVDRATMAYSLEARSPLMDYRVVELANQLPTDFKFSDGNQKRILKDVLYKYVPKEIFDRPKSGFSMPLEEWFRNDLKDLVLSELSPEGLKDIPGIKAEMVSTMVNEHMNETWNHFVLIWKLLVLKQWLRKNAAGKQIK